MYKITQGERDTLNKLIFISEIKSKINNFLKQNAPGLDVFNVEFYQTLQREFNTNFQQLVPENRLLINDTN